MLRLQNQKKKKKNQSVLKVGKYANLFQFWPIITVTCLVYRFQPHHSTPCERMSELRFFKTHLLHHFLHNKINRWHLKIIKFICKYIFHFNDVIVENISTFYKNYFLIKTIILKLRKKLMELCKNEHRNYFNNNLR